MNFTGSFQITRHCAPPLEQSTGHPLLTWCQHQSTAEDQYPGRPCCRGGSANAPPRHAPVPRPPTTALTISDPHCTHTPHTASIVSPSCRSDGPRAPLATEWEQELAPVCRKGGLSPGAAAARTDVTSSRASVTSLRRPRRRTAVADCLKTKAEVDAKKLAGTFQDNSTGGGSI